MKSKRVFFITAAIILITSAYQNSILASPLNAIPNTSLMTVLENTNPLQSISTTYFSILPTSQPAPCNNSRFIKDITIADGTELEPGAAFIKKWKIKNTGTCAWNKNFSLHFASGERMSGETTYLTKWVPPDQTIIISVELIAPEKEGAYTGFWILTDSNGTAFGNYFYLKIAV